MATAGTSRPTLSVEWLLGTLERNGLIDAVQARDLALRAPEQRARLLHQKAAAGAVEVSEVGLAVDIIASLAAVDPSGRPIDADRLAELVATEARLPYHKIDPLELDMQLVTRTLSRPFALRHVVLPLRADAEGIDIAVADPFDVELVEGLGRLVTGKIRCVVASKPDIVKAITEIYGFRKSIDSAAKQSVRDLGVSDFEQLVTLRNVGEIEASDQHVVNAVDFLLRYAFDQRASDIHIEPRRDDSHVRLRIDGVMHPTHKYPRQVHSAIVSRIKTLARMDIAEKRRPQDGRIKTAFGTSSVELRVSSLPVAFGEKMVIRIFDPDALLLELVDLGFEGPDHTTFGRWIDEPHGLILITGPTGSGKTTTLYTTLKRLAKDDVNVTTIEDPIEMVTDCFNQVSVQSKVGVDFPTALRTILRQDPDIIMVGEIRDAETAEMAIQAALTGHLVLSTLHTNDSVGAVTRLGDLGVPPFLVASTLVGVLAQRLVRRLCKDCRAPAPLTVDELAVLGITAAEAPRFVGTHTSVGCVHCRGTGYFGRVGVFEVFDMTQGLARLVQTGAAEDELRRVANSEGMRSLRACALDRLAQGVTSFEEVVRVTGTRDRTGRVLAAAPPI